MHPFSFIWKTDISLNLIIYVRFQQQHWELSFPLSDIKAKALKERKEKHAVTASFNLPAIRVFQ